jgi:hypothetical protein
MHDHSFRGLGTITRAIDTVLLYACVNARNLFRAGARVTFFGAKKVTKENTQVQFKSAI